MNATTLELDTLLRRFVEGDDTSLTAANRLELLLSELFPMMRWSTSASAISRNTGPAEASFSSTQRKCEPASAASAVIWRC